jgi:hypothetical protein
MKKKLILMTVLLFGLGVVLTSCVTVPVKPTEANFKAPVITLASFEVPQYDGYWYYGGKTKPDKGKAGAHGAPLPLNFVFSIENPNPYPILLQGMKYTVAFDKEFDMVTVSTQDACWIPAGKTNEVRSSTMITVHSGLLTLLVTGGYKLKAKGWNAWQALEKWWTGIPDYAVPVTVYEGAFTFQADGIVKVLPFEATVE